MLKKFGMVSVGITAGLLAVAPMASATEGHHSGNQEGTGNIRCSAEGGDFESMQGGSTTGGEASPVVLNAPVGPALSNNTGQAASCNSFLNDFANDNELNFASEVINPG